jgi:hypothetical protein
MGGGGFVGTANFTMCDGKDVARSLRKVFGNPGNNDYKKALDNINLFAAVANGDGNPQQLYDAYVFVGVAPCDAWLEYLKTLKPTEIVRIGQARFEGLSAKVPIRISTHNPQKNGDHHVHWTADLEDGTITIDSPFTPDAALDKDRPSVTD